MPEKQEVPRALRLTVAGILCLMIYAVVGPDLGGSRLSDGRIGYAGSDYMTLGIIFGPFLLVLLGCAGLRRAEGIGWGLFAFLLLRLLLTPA